jgi:ubiquinone/menaquinone biosynthesis C-methylase UbiE
MPEVMEFSKHFGKQLLEIGGGIGTDLSQFANYGAHTTDLDLSAGHLALAQENFRLRGLKGTFIHHDAEDLPFEDNTFDVVYSNGVIHHTPNTQSVIREMYRVLKPGGRVIVMVYAENSWHYWSQLVRNLGLKGSMLQYCSMGEIMSRTVEMTANAARPLVKVYTRERLASMFGEFKDVEILQRQITSPELPGLMRWLPVAVIERYMGWNLIVKGYKPVSGVEASLRAALPRSA